MLPDNEGRSIRFDVRVEGVDAEWYAAYLRAAPHGDEISTVTIRLVSWDELRSSCGSSAAGCYVRNRMTVPAEQSDQAAHTLVHEYAHHLDRSTAVSGEQEPNGTPHWWRSRGMDELVRLGSVKRDYGLGWSRSIAEIFAEDYARLALGATRAQDHLARRAGRDRPRRDQGRSRARAAARGRAAADAEAREHRPRRHPLPARARDDLLRPARPRAPRHRDRDARRPGEPRDPLRRRSRRPPDDAGRQGEGRDRPAQPRAGRVHGDAHEHEPVAPRLHARRPARRLARKGASAATAASRLARPAPSVSTAAGTPPGSPVSTTISGRRASTST